MKKQGKVEFTKLTSDDIILHLQTADPDYMLGVEHSPFIVKLENRFKKTFGGKINDKMVQAD